MWSRLCSLALVAGLAGCAGRPAPDPLATHPARARLDAERARLGFVRAEALWTQARVTWQAERGTVLAEVGFAPDGMLAWLADVACPSDGCQAPPDARQPAEAVAFDRHLARLASAPLLTIERVAAWQLPDAPADAMRTALADFGAVRARLTQGIGAARAVRVADERVVVRLLDDQDRVVGIAHLGQTTARVVWPVGGRPIN